MCRLYPQRVWTVHHALPCCCNAPTDSPGRQLFGVAMWVALTGNVAPMVSVFFLRVLGFAAQWVVARQLLKLLCVLKARWGVSIGRGSLHKATVVDKVDQVQLSVAGPVSSIGWVG